MRPLACRWILGAILSVYMIPAQALENTRNAFATPGLTNGENFEPYSTSTVSFTTLSSTTFRHTYLAEFSEPVNYIQFYWDVADPVSTADKVYLGPVYEKYPVIYGRFFDENGNDLNSFWQGGSGDNGGGLDSTAIFQSVEFTLGNIRARYLDRTGCAAGDVSCGVEVIEGLPIDITQFIYGIDTEAFPVPEPSTYAMLFAGLGLLALRFRKSRHQQPV